MCFWRKFKCNSGFFIKGTVSRDFLPLVFLIKQYTLGPWFTGLFGFFFKFAELWSIFGRKNRAWDGCHWKFLSGIPFKLIYFCSCGGRTIRVHTGFWQIFPLNAVRALRIVHRSCMQCQWPLMHFACSVYDPACIVHVVSLTLHEYRKFRITSRIRISIKKKL
jgi:hypothetical protein